IRC
ncbi:unnamed protein product, partial [Leptidea sinapis]